MNIGKKPESVIEFINFSSEFLKTNNISEARLNTELLLCDVLKCGRMDLYLNFDKPLSKDEVSRFKSFLLKRKNHEPVQYITGKSYFYGYEFNIRRGILIPRPETEILVEKVLDDIYKSGKKEVSVFEIGSGSGCISVSIASELLKKEVRANIISIDVSEEAIKLSEENSRKILPGCNLIRFLKKDLFELKKLTKDFNYIVSNPPYISKEDYSNLEPEVRLFEPEIGLTDGSDGFSFFRKIFELASFDDFTGKVFCEIGFNQSEAISKMLSELGFRDVEFYKDYSSIERILEIGK